MTRFPVPGDRRLEQLIRESFDFLPGPDMARLGNIEANLSHHLKGEKRGTAASTLPWWIVLLLTAGFAAAAWWAGERWQGKNPLTPPVNLQDKKETSGFETGKRDRDEARELHNKQDKSKEEDQSAVIYQRESF